MSIFRRTKVVFTPEPGWPDQKPVRKPVRRPRKSRTIVAKAPVETPKVQRPRPKVNPHAKMVSPELTSPFVERVVRNGVVYNAATGQEILKISELIAPATNQ